MTQRLLLPRLWPRVAPEVCNLLVPQVPVALVQQQAVLVTRYMQGVLAGMVLREETLAAAAAALGQPVPGMLVLQEQQERQKLKMVVSEEQGFLLTVPLMLVVTMVGVVLGDWLPVTLTRLVAMERLGLPG
jgi:hypothetical protein